MEISQPTKVLHHLFNTICIADWLEIQNIQNMKSSVIIHLFVKAGGDLGWAGLVLLTKY